jgi:hypothetical protein
MIIPIEIRSVDEILAALRSRGRLAVSVGLKDPMGFTEYLQVTGVTKALMELDGLPDQGASWFVVFDAAADFSSNFSKHVLGSGTPDILAAIWEGQTGRGLLFYNHEVDGRKELDLEAIYALQAGPRGSAMTEYLEGSIKADSVFEELNPGWEPRA